MQLCSPSLSLVSFETEHQCVSFIPREQPKASIDTGTDSCYRFLMEQGSYHEITVVMMKAREQTKRRAMLGVTYQVFNQTSYDVLLTVRAKSGTERI